MTTLEVSEKLALIKENLAEVLNPEIIESVLTEGRNLKIYWGKYAQLFTSLTELPQMLTIRYISLGTAITGRPHCGYFGLLPEQLCLSMLSRADYR